MVSDKHIKLPTCPKISEKQLSLKLGDAYFGRLLTLPIEGELNIRCSNFVRTFDSLMASLTYSRSDFKVPWLGKPV